MTRTLAFALILSACSIAESPPYIALDGDTISVGAGPHIRLAYIDAPELPGHCRPGRQCAPGDPYASRAYLQGLLNEGTLRCISHGLDVYGRMIGDCRMTSTLHFHDGETSLSTIMLAAGYAEPYRH